MKALMRLANLKQRMEIDAGAAPRGGGVDDGAEAHDRGQRQHQRGESVRDQHDAERSLPVRREIDADRRRIGAAVDAHVARLSGVDLPAASTEALRVRAAVLRDDLRRRMNARHPAPGTSAPTVDGPV